MIYLPRVNISKTSVSSHFSASKCARPLSEGVVESSSTCQNLKLYFWRVTSPKVWDCLSCPLPVLCHILFPCWSVFPPRLNLKRTLAAASPSISAMLDYNVNPKRGVQRDRKHNLKWRQTSAQGWIITMWAQTASAGNTLPVVTTYCSYTSKKKVPEVILWGLINKL